MRIRHFVLVTVILISGCTAAQIHQALTGHPATTQPIGGLAGVPPGDAGTTDPTPGSIEGITKNLQILTAAVTAASTGTPVSGYAAIASAILALLIAGERLADRLGISAPNSQSSLSQSNSGSGGGTDSPGNPPSQSSNLKAA